MKLLLLEDNSWFVRLLKKALTEQHYAIDTVTDLQSGWKFLRDFKYDLILLNLVSPVLDSIGFIREVRMNGYRLPILLLTDENAIQYGIYGLDAGADDYIVKPCNLQDLLARIRALSRRGSSGSFPIMEWGNLCLDSATCEVTYKKDPLKLTPLEYRLLELFLRNGSSVLSCSVIRDNLWSYEEYPQKDTIKSHVKRLRKKLKDAGVFEDFIETVYGLGYRLNRNWQDFREPIAMAK